MTRFGCLPLSATVTEDDIRRNLACGPGPDRHVAAIRPSAEAGHDRIHICRIGPEPEGLFDFYARQVLPRPREDRTPS